MLKCLLYLEENFIIKLVVKKKKKGKRVKKYKI